MFIPQKCYKQCLMPDVGFLDNGKRCIFQWPLWTPGKARGGAEPVWRRRSLQAQGTRWQTRSMMLIITGSGARAATENTRLPRPPASCWLHLQAKNAAPPRAEKGPPNTPNTQESEVHVCLHRPPPSSVPVRVIFSWGWGRPHPG